MGDTIHIGFGEQYHYWYRWYEVTQYKYSEGYRWKNPNTEVITIDICIADFQPQACAQAIVSKKGNYNAYAYALFKSRPVFFRPCAQAWTAISLTKTGVAHPCYCMFRFWGNIGGSRYLDVTIGKLNWSDILKPLNRLTNLPQ